MEELEANGISVFGIASNLRDAKVLVSSGVNAVVAAGWAEEGLLSHEEIVKIRLKSTPWSYGRNAQEH